MKKILFFICGLFVASSGYGYDLDVNASESNINTANYDGSGKQWFTGDGLLQGNFVDLTDDIEIYDLDVNGVILTGEVGVDTDFIDLNGNTLSITASDGGTPTDLIMDDTILKDTVGGGVLNAVALTLTNSSLDFSNGSTINVSDITLNNSSMEVTGNTSSFTNLTFQGASTYTGDDLVVSGTITIDPTIVNVNGSINLTGNLSAGSFEQTDSTNAVDFIIDVVGNIDIDTLSLEADGNAEYEFNAGGEINLGSGGSTLISNADVSFTSDSFVSSNDFSINNDASVSITATNNVDMDRLTITSGSLTLNTTTAEIDTFLSLGSSTMNLTFDSLESNTSLVWNSAGDISLTAKEEDGTIGITTAGTSSILDANVIINDDLVWNNSSNLGLTATDFDLQGNNMAVSGNTQIATHTSNATTFVDGVLNLEGNLSFQAEGSGGDVASLVLTDVVATVGGDVALGTKAELRTEGGSFEVLNNKTITMEDNSMISTTNTDFIANDIVMNDGAEDILERTRIQTTDGSFTAKDISFSANAYAVMDFMGTDVNLETIIFNADNTTDLILKNDSATTISGIFSTNEGALRLETDNLTIGSASWRDSTINIEDYDGDATGQITFNNTSATDFVDTQFNVNGNMRLVADDFTFNGTDFETFGGDLTIQADNVLINGDTEIVSSDPAKEDIDITGNVIIEVGAEVTIQNVNFSASSFESRGGFEVIDSNITSTINNNFEMNLEGINTLTNIVNTDGELAVSSGITTANDITFNDSFFANNTLQIDSTAELVVDNLINYGTLNYDTSVINTLKITSSFSNSGTMIINSQQLGIDQFSTVKTINNSGVIDVLLTNATDDITNSFELKVHEIIENTTDGVLEIHGNAVDDFAFTNNGTITGGEVVLDGVPTVSELWNNKIINVDRLTITSGDFYNQITGLVNSDLTVITSGTFTNNGELHGDLEIFDEFIENKTGDQTVDYNVNIHDGGVFEISGNVDVLTFEGDLSIVENSDLIIVGDEFLLDGTMTINENKTGFSLHKINNNGAIVLGNSANTLSIGASEIFKNNGIITGEREVSIASTGTWEQNGNSFASDLVFTNAGDFKFGDSVSHMTVRNSFTNTGTIVDADDVLISLDGGTWTENNDLDLQKIEVFNEGIFEVGADIELSSILEINEGMLELKDNDLQITNGNLTMKDSVVLMQRDGDNNISVDGNAYLKDVAFDFAGTLTGQRLLATEEITLVSAGGNLLQDNILILNWDDILAIDTIGILSQDGNDLNLQAVAEMNYETIADFSENNNNMAEIMTELQDATRTAGQNQLLMYFAAVANNGTPEETREALEAIRPQNIDASLKTSAFIDSSILNQITNHMESNSRFARINNDYKLPKDSVWFDVSYVSSATDRVADFNEYSTKGGVASFGREIEIANNVFTGGVATFGSTSTEGLSEDGKDSYEIDTQTMALSGYLQYVSKYVSFSGTAGGSMQSHDLERTTFLENKAKADYTMTNYFAKFSGELSVLKNIIPAVFVSQQHLGAIDYTENGADGENLNVKGEEADLTQAGASLRLQTEFNKVDLKIVPYVKVETKTLVSGDEGIKFENSFVAGGSQFENTANTFDDSSTVISAGVDVFENISATKTSILYQMEQTENTTNHQIGLQMNLMF